MLVARRTSTAYPLELAVRSVSGSPVLGLVPSLRVRDGATSNSYLDFDDMTFKTSGWVQQDADLSEVGGGHYEYDLDISSIVGVASVESLVAEYHVPDSVDASDVLVLDQVATVGLNLTVSDDSGGIDGLSATVRVRDSPSDDRFLDWNDLTFKTSGWGLRDAPMTAVGRGHYHRAIDAASVVGLTDGIMIAEFSTTGAVETAASERFPFGIDSTPPVVDVVTPPAGSPIGVNEALVLDVMDETSLALVVIHASFPNKDEDEVIFNGDDFTDLYSTSSRSPISGGHRYTIRRDGGWPGTPTLNFIPVDTSGNISV